MRYLLVLVILSVAIGGYLYFTPHPAQIAGQSTEKPEKSKSIEKPTIILEAPKIVRDVTPNSLVKAPIPEQDTLLERLPAKKVPVVKKKAKPVKWTRPEVLKAGLVRVNGTAISFAGVDPIELDTVCEAKSGETWPCGRFARTSFRNFLRGRTITCDPRDVPESGQDIYTACRVGKTDIGSWLIANGWARPTNDVYSKEHKTAKDGRLGIWREETP